VLSACVAAVKCRPVLHHCVINLFFWSSGTIDCLFTFENGVPLMRQGASVVWHLSLPLMNSFNKTEAAVFSFRPCFVLVPMVEYMSCRPCQFSVYFLNKYFLGSLYLFFNSSIHNVWFASFRWFVHMFQVNCVPRSLKVQWFSLTNMAFSSGFSILITDYIFDEIFCVFWF